MAPISGTEEDYMRDYPPKPWAPFALPWEKEYHDKELKKVAEKTKVEGKAEGKIEDAKVMLSKGLEVSLIAEITGLPEADILKLQSTVSA